MFQNYRYEMNDSIRKKLADSLGIVFDTTAMQPVDSTARLKYFQYIPSYSYGTSLKSKTHPLLLENSSFIKKEVSFNEKNQIIIRETFNGEDIRAPLIMELSDYISTEEKKNTVQVFTQIFDETYKGITADELSQLFEKITDITIPLPFKSETIFGPPTFNLKINGAVDITASFQNIQSEQASFIDNNQNNINFKQEVQVNAKGSIGDKLTVEADWNTQRTFDFENQLKLKYTGYADEVIQKIEAGNVSLDTKSSLIQSTQALFGVKGEFKLGPLTLSSVVSQKKSKQEEKTFSQGVQEQNFQIQVWDYSDSHYLIDTLYKTSFLEVYGDSTGTNSFSTFVNENRLKITGDNFEVWMQCDVTESRKRFAVGKVMLAARPSTGYDTSVTTPEVIIGDKFAGYFRKLDPTEYYYNEYAGYINLKISVTTNMHVGVVYENYKGEKYGKGERECASNENLILKLFKIDNQIPSIAPLAWELKLKNIYRLPVSKILEDGFKLEVLYNNNNTLQPTVPGALGNKSLSTITKIDRFTGKELSPPPDGIFDFRIGKTINPETGDVIFPTLRPFYDAIKLNGGDSSLQFLEIYTLNKSEAQQTLKSTLYTISGSAKGEAGISNTFNLGLNVVLGSVQVLMGGTKLQENVDYSVDYTSGIVTIRNIAALTAKDLKITYETNDLFTLASKTFIGLRGDYQVSEKTNFGFTFVNLSQETLNDKVRIGEEPTNNSMFGLDFTSELKTNFVTKALNILPGYNTKEESSFSLRGEFAYLTPDPNTKKSQIPQDNNEAIAYIDDMEGAKKIISLGTSYQAWTIASLPIDSMLTTNDSLHSQDRRGGIKWYTVPNDVDVKDVYPLRDVQPGQDRLSPMYISFDPGVRGCYNYNAVNYDTINKNNNWNGIMKYLNTTSTDLIAENINYIEFNMRVEKYGNYSLENAKMYIDLGIISEDALPNNVYNTEDIIQNGTLQENEDIGLDTLTDAQELTKFNLKNGTNFQSLDEYFNVYGNRDPAGDNNTESQTINV
ncbi:MAG: cell surface protein SprA, partial [Ignavibacteria bacterium]|nr:cell surface protein SprA [Ignavibacteria bacterium]